MLSAGVGIPPGAINRDEKVFELLELSSRSPLLCAAPPYSGKSVLAQLIRK